MNTQKYRKRPIVIEAVQVTFSNVYEVANWCGGSATTITSPQPTADIYIPTLEGQMQGSIGDYVIKGAHGGFYICRGQIFEDTYEVVER